MKQRVIGCLLYTSYLVDEIDEDEKIDYFAMLTRAFLLTTLERDMYFKLAKIITMCTSFELGYLKELPLDFESENNTWISSCLLYTSRCV